MGERANKKGGPTGPPLWLGFEPRLTRIEFDDQIWFHLHRIRHFVERWHASKGYLVVAVWRYIFRNVAFGEALGFDDQRHFLCLVTKADDVACCNLTAGDIALYAVYANVTVADDLASSEDRWGELGAVYDHVEAAFEQTDKVLRRIALHVACFMIRAPELLFGHVAVIALQLLLGAELSAVVGHLAFTALTVLTGAVFTLVDRGFRATPDVFTHPAVKFILRAFAHRHNVSPIANNDVSGTARSFDKLRTSGQKAGHLLHRSAGSIAKAGLWLDGADKSTSASTLSSGVSKRAGMSKTADIVEPLDCNNMAEVRAGVDAVDVALIDLLARRFGYMDAAARIKTDRDSVRDEVRKAEVIDNVKSAAASAGVPVEAAAALWEQLVEASIAYELKQWDAGCR